MIGSLFHTVYISDLSTILIAMPIIMIAWSVFGAHFYQRMRIISSVLAICFIAVILYMTIFSRTPGTRYCDLIPFSSFQKAQVQPEFYRSMLMNVFLFFPLGLVLPFVFKGSTVKRILLAILISFALSALIEAFQYFFSLGQSEAGDVICNTIGTAFGGCSYLLSLLWRKTALKLRKGVKSDE